MEEDQNPEGLAAERRAGPRFSVDDDATLLLEATAGWCRDVCWT